MPASQPQTEGKRVHPEEIYQAELAATEVSPAVARVMTWGFVAIIFGVSLSQLTLELSRGQKPQALALFQPLAVAGRDAVQARWKGALEGLKTLVARQHLHGFEADLERASWAKSFFQPRLQEWITGVGGFGNDKGTLGRNGWLFYQPGLDYVTGADFTDQRVLQSATKKMVDKNGETDPHPDPRPAILQLNDALQQAGIHLVVMPAPDKAMVQPRELTRRLDGARPMATLQNRGYARFAEEMRSKGVDVFDCAPETVRPGEVRFLEQDTHWSPDFMEQASRDLAVHIRKVAALPPAARFHPMQLVEMRVSRVGDLVDMLKLPPWQRLYPPRTATIHQVVDAATGKPWEPDAQADVLLMGDSYANIYSQPGMGWGQAAGLAEHLSYELQRPVDSMAMNGGGFWATRAELSRGENLDRLAVKRVVVYEFAVRDLLGQNWKPAPLASPEAILNARNAHRELAPAAPVVSAAPAVPAAALVKSEPALPAAAAATPGEIVLTGRIIKTSEVPKPGTAPYKDCLTFIKFEVERVESGVYEKPAIIVAFWAMKDDVWLPGAEYAVGDRFRMKLIPMRQAGTAIRSMQRADNLDDLELQPYFSLEETKR
jgi:alginate O-acetyltransferase complex protein AlgJ